MRRTIERVENALLVSGQFSLPRRKVLMDDFQLEVVVVDVAESPIEQPKRRQAKTILFREENAIYPLQPMGNG